MNGSGKYWFRANDKFQRIQGEIETAWIIIGDRVSRSLSGQMRELDDDTLWGRDCVAYLRIIDAIVRLRRYPDGPKDLDEAVSAWLDAEVLYDLLREWPSRNSGPHSELIALMLFLGKDPDPGVTVRELIRVYFEKAATVREMCRRLESRPTATAWLAHEVGVDEDGTELLDRTHRQICAWLKTRVKSPSPNFTKILHTLREDWKQRPRTDTRATDLQLLEEDARSSAYSEFAEAKDSLRETIEITGGRPLVLDRRHSCLTVDKPLSNAAWDEFAAEMAKLMLADHMVDSTMLADAERISLKVHDKLRTAFRAATREPARESLNKNSSPEEPDKWMDKWPDPRSAHEENRRIGDLEEREVNQLGLDNVGILITGIANKRDQMVMRYHLDGMTDREIVDKLQESGIRITPAGVQKIRATSVIKMKDWAQKFRKKNLQ